MKCVKSIWKVSETLSKALYSICINLIITNNFIIMCINWWDNINENKIIYPKYKLKVWRLVGRWAKFSPMLLAPIESI
jgi:hypothetical protein